MISFRGADPIHMKAYVNYNAFMAHLEARHFQNRESRFVYDAMSWAFLHVGREGRFKDPTSSDVDRPRRDTYVLGAAQWILWNGQGLLHRAIYCRPPAGGKVSDTRYFDIESTAMSLDKWRLWKQGFRDAVTEPGASDECKKVALKAADMMDMLERGMLF